MLKNCYIMILCFIWIVVNMICLKSLKYVYVYIILEISIEVLMGDYFMDYYLNCILKLMMCNFVW